MSEGLLARAQLANSFDINNYTRLYFRDGVVGFVRNDRVPLLTHYTDVFKIQDGKLVLQDSDDVEIQWQMVINQLRDQGHVNPWRGDHFSVHYAHTKKELLQVDRGASTFFGTFVEGVHMNGYKVGADGYKYVVLQKRAAHLKFAPGAYDTLVGASLPKHVDPVCQIVNEAYYEAGLITGRPNKYRQINPITYWWERGNDGVVPERVHIFDVELPWDWEPCPKDGEAEKFDTVRADHLRAILENAEDITASKTGKGKFKVNSGLIMVDFLMRHDYVAKGDPTYPKIKQMLRTPLTRYS